MADGRRVNPYSFSPNTSTEYQRFKSDYFTGADVRIYFGDLWVDEVNNLQFSLQEQVAPIFGYASYTWEKVARGTRYVQGSFTINFKESAYLHMILAELSDKLNRTKDTKPMPLFDTKQYQEGTTIEQLLSMGSNAAGFGKLADNFEQSLWGQGPEVTRRQTKNKGTFFAPDVQGGNSINMQNQGMLGEHGFNIVITYGAPNEKDGMKTKETVHTIVGVQLTGVSQIIGGDGRPVEEQYTFIAKDLDGNAAVIN